MARWFLPSAGLPMYAPLKFTASLLVPVLLAILSACHSDKSSCNEPSLSQVDSRIQTLRINDKTLLLSFGAESISAICTDRGIVVIDAGISTGLTGLFREHMENAWNGGHFAYVINTHAHHDHCRGNSVFPEAEIVGQANGIKSLEEQWEDPRDMQEFLMNTAKGYESGLKDCVPGSEAWEADFRQFTRYLYAFKDANNLIPIRKPSLVFADDLVIDMGNVNFHLHYFGHCHSNSDILIHVPELKLLFTGDLMSESGRPSIRDRTMAEKDVWLESLAWTEERMDQIETVIGGHGQLLSADDLKAFVGIMHHMLTQNRNESTP